MNIEEIMAQLKKNGGFFELYSKTTFTGYRLDSNGNQQKVEVDILDAGSDKPTLRYSCEARSEDGKMATGNPERSIGMAIIGVHWNKLDN